MSFVGFYQQVCINGHYCECNSNAHHEKCIDCHCDLIFDNLVDDTNCEQCGYARIPTDKTSSVEESFFKKYLSTKEKVEYFRERNKQLIPPYCFGYNKKDYPLEVLIDKFQYFDKNKTLKIEFKLDKDAGGELVPYVIATFGSYNYDRSSVNYMQWQTMYIDDYGQENLDQIGYECFEMCYDADVYYIVLELYKNMWNRCFKYGFNA